MIQSERGNVTISGTGYEVLADISIVVHSVYHTMLVGRGMPEERARELLIQAVESGIQAPKEISAENDDISQEETDVLSGLKELIQKIINGKDDE